MVIKARKEAHMLQKVKKVTDTRGRRPGTSITRRQSLADIMLEEFFMPYRKTPLHYTHDRRCYSFSYSISLSTFMHAFSYA